MVVLASSGSAPAGASFPTSTNLLQFQATGLMPGTEYSVSVTTNDKLGLVDESAKETEITGLF